MIFHRQYFTRDYAASLFAVLHSLLAGHPSYTVVDEYVPALQPSEATDPLSRDKRLTVDLIRVWEVSAAGTAGVPVQYYLHLALLTRSGAPGQLAFALSEGYAGRQLVRPAPPESANNIITPHPDGSLGPDQSYGLYVERSVERPDRTQTPTKDAQGRNVYPMTTYSTVVSDPEIQILPHPLTASQHEVCIYISARALYLNFSNGAVNHFMGFGTYDSYVPTQDDPVPAFMFSTSARAARVTRMPYVQNQQALNYAVTDAMTTPFSVLSGELLGRGDRLHGQRAIMSRMTVRQLGKTDTHGGLRGLYPNLLHAKAHGGTVEIPPRLTQVEFKTRDATWKVLGQRRGLTYLVNLDAE